MSKESAAAFLAKVDADPELKSKVQALGQGAGFDDLQDVAAVAGYKFNIDDLIEAGKDRLDTSIPVENELSEEDLDAVAGGTVIISIWISQNSVKISVKQIP